jgi:hypothetical protein
MAGGADRPMRSVTIGAGRVSSSSFSLRRTKGEWTGTPGLMRPSGPQSAIRLKGMAGRSSIASSVRVQSSSVRYRRAATTPGSG